MDPIDYTPILTTIAGELARIATALEAGNTQFAAYKTAFDDLQSDVNALKVRGVDSELGIVIASTDENLDRAVLVNALKQGNQLQNVLKELGSPTPIPGA